MILRDIQQLQTASKIGGGLAVPFGDLCHSDDCDPNFAHPTTSVLHCVDRTDRSIIAAELRPVAA